MFSMSSQRKEDSSLSGEDNFKPQLTYLDERPRRLYPHRLPVISTVTTNYHSLPPGMVASPSLSDGNSVSPPYTVPISVITSTSSFSRAGEDPGAFPPSAAGQPCFRTLKKKRAQPIPEDRKDDAYWEKRKRNNESAKRSRELRRVKEKETSKRVRQLEEENLRLRTEVSILKSELETMRQLMCNKVSSAK